MDFSEKYTEMCRKASKLQCARPIKPGDYVALYNRSQDDFIDHFLCTGLDGRNNLILMNAMMGQRESRPYPKSKHFFCWLPRQDQLQEMIGTDWILIDADCRKMGYEYCVVHNIPTIDITQHITKEISTLMVFMKVCCNEKWNGVNWVQL